MEHAMRPHLRPKTNDDRIWNMVFEDNLYGLRDLEGTTVIDVGAHIGSFTQKAVKLGATSVLSVEANPDNFAVLEINTREEPFVVRRLAALDYGVSALVPVSAFDPSNTGRVYSGTDAISRAHYFVPQIRLEVLLDLVPTAQIDILKLDCQGAEWQLFNRAPDNVWQRFNEIVGEIHADLHLEHLLAFLTREVGPHQNAAESLNLRPRDWAIKGVRSFAKKHGYEVAFSLDDEDENSAEFHAFRHGAIARCKIDQDA
jgi:FkbM family methyltransferase